MNSESLWVLIKHTYFDTNQLFSERSGISQARMLLLVKFRRTNEWSQAALVQQLGIDAAAVTRQVKQLEEEGLVQRRADPDDNRYTLVSLTPAGRALVEQLVHVREELEALSLEGIAPEDVAAARRALTRIRDNVRALEIHEHSDDSQK